MSSTSENYLFLGLPKSGKTTYFVLMAQYLQKEANRDPASLCFRYPTETEKFIDDGIDQLRKQRWPAKTQKYEHGYSFELACSRPQHSACFQYSSPPTVFRSALINYHDYPGEAYEAAFGVGDAPSPKMQESAQNLKERILTARGIFLLIDADALFTGVDDQKSRIILTELFRYILQSNPTLKLAVIFNKLELFSGKEPDFEQLFREKYSNAYAHLLSLSDNSHFFKVYPLGEVETAEDGKAIPPQTLHPKNIFEPVDWMIIHPEKDTKKPPQPYVTANILIKDGKKRQTRTDDQPPRPPTPRPKPEPAPTASSSNSGIGGCVLLICLAILVLWIGGCIFSC